MIKPKLCDVVKSRQLAPLTNSTVLSGIHHFGYLVTRPHIGPHHWRSQPHVSGPKNKPNRPKTHRLTSSFPLRSLLLPLLKPLPPPRLPTTTAIPFSVMATELHIDSVQNDCRNNPMFNSKPVQIPPDHSPKMIRDSVDNKVMVEDVVPLEKRSTPLRPGIVRPHKLLPQPETPPGLLLKSFSSPAAATATKSLLDRGGDLSSAVARRIFSFREFIATATEEEEDDLSQVTEFHLKDTKVVVVKLKKEVDFDGRISFFSRSGCRDCGAVRTFLRDRHLPFFEINIDVYPERVAELADRTGGVSVPAIFFNEKLVGGLVALNSLRNSGEFDRRLRELAGRRCPDSAPLPPVYGFDDEELEMAGRREDGLVGVVRVIRQRLPMQDRLVRMKIARNCFAGEDLTAAVAGHLGCGREKVRSSGLVLVFF